MDKRIDVDYNYFKHYSEMMDDARRNMDKILAKLNKLSTQYDELEEQYRRQCDDFWQADRELQKIFAESAYFWFNERIGFCKGNVISVKDLFNDYKQWCKTTQMPYTQDCDRFLWRLNNIINKNYSVYIGKDCEYIRGAIFKTELDKGSEDSGRG